MASGDVFKVTLQMSLDAVQCRPGFYLVEGAGSAGPNPVAACAQAVADALGANPMAGFIQNCTLDNIRVDDIQPGTLVYQFPAVWTFDAGTIADDNPPPPQDSMLISMYTPIKRTLGNYAAMGRMYLPGIYSTGQVSGFLTSTLKTALDAFVAKLSVPFVEDGSAYQMHVVSFNPGTNPRTVRAIQPVNYIAGSNQVAIQRPRRPGTGI